MEAKRTEVVRQQRPLADGAYGFSFSIALGLVLFIAGLVMSLAMDEGGSGLVVGIPLILAGVAVPLFMMRGNFTRSEINAPCPGCGAQIKTTDATLQLDCPACGQTVQVRDQGLYAATAPKAEQAK
ncbi:MAG TPA: hypothetical protein VF723_12090 [Pyrinomonadaceae bacterium]|jgi:predicted RNA-binding Zn-ribbon protein involved in translation (DUF1610 family)